MDDTAEAQLDRWWAADGPVHRRFGAFRAAAAEHGVAGPVLDATVTAFVRMGHGTTEEWRRLFPWVRHVHAKYWDWEDAESQVVVPQAHCLAELAAAGYEGSVSSEWGGSEWHGLEVDTVALTRRHLDALRGAVVSPA
jgi:hypothetical protein